MMERKGTVITCDRCGAQVFGEIVETDGVGAARYPKEWESRTCVMGRGFIDLCPECAAEYIELTREWWDRGAKAQEGAAS